MKIHTYLLFSVLSLATIAGSAHGSVYSTTFSTLYNGLDLNGWNGWTVNDPSVGRVAYGVNTGGAQPWGPGGTAAIGSTTPSIDNVYAYYGGTNTPLVGGGVDGRFSAWYQIVDSTYYVNGVGDPVNANRDQFGFSLRTSAGVDLFTFYLTPYTQTVFPVIPENAPSTDTYSWSSAYANGGSPTVVVPTLASEYGKAYLFEVDFSPIAGTNDVLFSATNQGVDLFTGVLNNASNQVIGQVGAIWNPTYGAANAGTNVLVFDNVSLVPEPSSALLGLLGASFVFVRRRRA